MKNQKKQPNYNPLKHPDQRVGVFIDVQNMYYSAKNLLNELTKTSKSVAPLNIGAPRSKLDFNMLY